MKAFTLLEILIVILIFLILFAVISPFLSFRETEPDRETVYLLLNRARIKALAGFQDSSWGVRLIEREAVLFKGDSYEERSFERRYSISLEEEKEFVFEKITGLIDHPDQVLDIYVNDFGIIILEEEEGIERENIDSRKVLIRYNRFIDQEEKIVLNEEEFLIQEFLKDGNLYLEHQDLLVTTLELNNPDTFFLIKRDRRFNDQPLVVSLEGDPDVMINYSADGMETTSESLFVEEIKWK